MVLSPILTNAQNPPPAGAGGGVITQQQMANMKKASSDARIERNAKGIEDGPAYQNAIKLCREIALTLHAISGGKSSMRWSSGDRECFAAAVVKGPPGPDKPNDVLNLPFMTIPDTEMQTYMLGLLRGDVTNANGQKQLDQTTLEKRESKKAETEEVTIWSKIINFVVVGAGNVLASALAGIGSLILGLLGVVLDATTGDLPRPAIVDKGWKIIRDLVNLFFIIALIVMALGTILRKDEYSYKRLLAQLIFMALLVNFSQVIAVTLISFSDTLINLFNPQISMSASFTLLYEAFVAGGDGYFSGFIGSNLTISSGIMATVMKLIALVLLDASLLAITGLMFVRLVGLWFMIMVSPVFFGLNILPTTKKYATDFRETFVKYLIWGPVAMFFLNLSFVFIQETGGSFVANPAFNYLFISAFLWAGYSFAKKSGMHGSGFVTNVTDKAMNKARSWGTSGAKGGAQMVGNSLWRGTAPAGIAAGGRYLIARGRRQTHEEAKEAMGQTYDKVKNKIGGATAAVSNWPKVAIKERFSDRPDKERKELVEKQQRRMQLSRNYLKDFDKDNANKISHEDVDFLVEEGLLNEAKVRNIMENGNARARERILAHLKQGTLKKKNADDKEFDAIVDVVRTRVWKDKGGLEINLHENFMKNEDGTVNTAHIVAKPVKSDYQGKTEDLPPKEVRVEVPLELVREMHTEVKDRKAKEKAEAAPKPKDDKLEQELRDKMI